MVEFYFFFYIHLLMDEDDVDVDVDDDEEKNESYETRLMIRKMFAQHLSFFFFYCYLEIHSFFFLSIIRCRSHFFQNLFSLCDRILFVPVFFSPFSFPYNSVCCLLLLLFIVAYIIIIIIHTCIRIEFKILAKKKKKKNL